LRNSSQLIGLCFWSVVDIDNHSGVDRRSVNPCRRLSNYLSREGLAAKIGKARNRQSSKIDTARTDSHCDQEGAVKQTSGESSLGQPVSEQD
jgi:hypothetical protein